MAISFEKFAYLPPPSAYPLAAGLITPGFAVAGVLLVAIPVIIHLLNRRRFKTIDWAAMSFLLAAVKKNRRRLKFEQWLLLATRCALIAMLGMALARPVGCAESSALALAGNRSGLHVIVIDNSYSMAYEADRPGAKTHLDQAKLLARRLIERLSSGGESVAIVTASSPGAAVVVEPIYDLQAARDAVDRVTQSYSGTDLPGALRIALEIGRRESRQPEKYLHVITDATRSALEGPQAQGLDTIGAELSKVFHVSVSRLATGNQYNGAAVDLRPGSALVRLRFNNDFAATVRGFGTAPSDAILQWRLDEQILPGSPTVKPAPDTPDLTQGQLQFTTGGAHTLAVSLKGDDRLPIDNDRWRVVNVAADLKVLIVEGERGIGALSGSGAFLELALAPASIDVGSGRPKSSSYVVPERISDLELGNRVLADYRAIVLAGVGQVQPAMADQLQRFVQDGGTFILFMGEAVVSDNYNNVLLPRGLMPGTLTKRITAGGNAKPFLFDFKPSGLLHPLLKAFARLENTGMDTAQVFTYWQMSLPPGSTAQRVLDYLPASDGTRDAAITVSDVGQGRVVFVSTTANAEWTSLPAKPAYLSLVHELLGGTVGAGDRWMNLTVGQSLEVPASLKLTAQPTLKDPSQTDVLMEPIAAAVAGGSAPVAYKSRPLDKPGLYSLATGTQTLPIAVNLPAGEADVRAVDEAGIRKAFGGADIDLSGDELPPPRTADAPERDFGWSVMLIVLALLGFECFLAMSFGAGRGSLRTSPAPNASTEMKT